MTCELAAIVGLLGGIAIGAFGLAGWAILTTAKMAVRQQQKG